MHDTWIEYESPTYRVWGNTWNYYVIEQTETGESVCLQDDSATRFATELQGVADNTSDEFVQFKTDDYLSQYFGN